MQNKDCARTVVDLPILVGRGRAPLELTKRRGLWGQEWDSESHTVNFGKKLKIRKRSNKNNCETSASNV